MKTAIIYATLSGTTEKCANLLAEKLGGAELFNIKNGFPDIDGFDFIIIGCAFYAANIDKKLKKFISENKDVLQKKPHAVYVCCASPESDYKVTLAKNINESLLDSAKAVERFGYEINIDNAKGFAKFVLKIMRKVNIKQNLPLSCLDETKIAEFVKTISA